MKKSLTAISLGVLTALAVVAQEATIPGDSVSTMRNVELDELVVKESLVKHSTKSDTYKVTEAMRRGVDGTMQLLGRLPGVDYNLVTNSISVRNDTKVQILVNGNQVEDSYLKALPPDRIDKVEVTYVPQARFAMAGYKYVIDIKLKHEYRGHDIYVGNFMMVSAGDNNGDDVVANEQPQAMYMYSGDKVDFNIGYAFAHIKWHYPLSYTKTYPGIADIFTDEYTEKSPNDRNSMTLTRTPINYNLQVTYSHNNLYASITVASPFSRNKTTSRLDTPTYGFDTTSMNRVSSRLCYITLSYTFDFGRTIQKIKKDLNTDVNSSLLQVAA